MTPTQMRRVAMRASGMAIKDIALAEGVTPVRIRDHLKRVPYSASRRATPGSTLPDGLVWTTDMHGNPYATEPPSTGRRGRKPNLTRPEMMQWVLTVLEATEEPEPYCEKCGRAL